MSNGSNVVNLPTQLAALEKEKKDLIDQLEAKARDFSQREQALKEELVQLRSGHQVHIDAHQTQLTQVQKDLQQTQTKLATAEAELARLQAELTKAKAEVTTHQQALIAAKEDEMTTLKNLLAGFGALMIVVGALFVGSKLQVNWGGQSVIGTKDVAVITTDGVNLASKADLTVVENRLVGVIDTKVKTVDDRVTAAEKSANTQITEVREDLKTTKGVQVALETRMTKIENTVEIKVPVAKAPAKAPDVALSKTEIPSDWDHYSVKEQLMWFATKCDWNLDITSAVKARGGSKIPGEYVQKVVDNGCPIDEFQQPTRQAENPVDARAQAQYKADDLEDPVPTQVQYRVGVGAAVQTRNASCRDGQPPITWNGQLKCRRLVMFVKPLVRADLRQDRNTLCSGHAGQRVRMPKADGSGNWLYQC